jgi:predicted secreted Zn-dependent protease
MPAISASYFGGGVTIARFRITGDTRSQILRSVRSRGPHGGAMGVTQPYLKYRFTFKYDRRGRCRVVRTGSAAVTMSFRITLPRWAATVGTDQSTASWWAAELRQTAAHERHHVRLWRSAVREANRVVAGSSCRNVGRRLEAVWRKAAAANCRFDGAEYGISMRACLRR